MNGLGLVGRVLGCAAALAVISGCSASDPEREIRERIGLAVVAAETRDTGFFRGLIAPSYMDWRGNDRRSIINLLRGQFLIHQRIEVISRIQTISIEAEGAAQVVIAAGLVGSASQRLRPGEISADLYRIELEWIKDGGDWQIIGARWSRSGEF